MRIACEKCSAAYAIDDKFVTPKGVRAQCPRCRHLQLVKKEEPAPPPPPPDAPPPSPFLFDLGAAPQPPTSRGAPLPSSSAALAFDFSSPPPPSEQPASAPAGGFDFAALSAPAAPPPAPSGSFDFGGLQPPPAQPPSTDAMLDFVAPVRAGEASRFDFGAEPPPSSGAPPAPAESIARCKSCGKEMTDPFDQALGTCDDCRSKSHESQGALPVDSGAGRIERVETAAIQSQLRGEEAPPRESFSALPPVPQPAPNAISQPLKSVISAARYPEDEGTGSRRKYVVAAVVVVALIAGGAFFAFRRPWSKRAPVLVTRSTGDQHQPVDALIQQWKLNYPELAGESSRQAKSYLEEGESLLRKDTTGSYLDAEEEFQKALVLDPSLDRAVAGWVLSIAFGRGQQIDEQTAKAAEALLVTAEKRGAEPRLFLAHAHLLIVRGGNPNDIKMLADRGQTSADPADKALAALALGQTFLVRNPQLAGENFSESLRLDPKLKRGYFFQAQLAVIQGQYKTAVQALERRLELDKDQWEAAEELARLYIDVGELAKARKVLENAKAASPAAGRPRLDLAMFDYQAMGELTKAQEQLTGIVNDAAIPRAERTDGWVHLAVVARLSGDLPRALDAIDQALEANPNSVPARLQKFLVLVERNVTSSARLELDALKGKLNDPQLEATLEGRLLLGENRAEEALKVLAAVYDADPRRVDALLLAGAAAARARKDGRAWELCLKKGIHADPRVYPIPPLTHLYVRPADVLKPAVGAYESLSPNSDEDPNPALCEGLVAWYAADLAGAERFFARVNTIDPRNADAYAFRAYISLAHRDVTGANRLLARGLDASKSSAHVYVGQALVASQTNRPDAEKTAANNALKFNPALLSAKTLLGEAEARLNQSEDARHALTTVLLTDPLFRDAKRVLYKQEL